MNRSEHVLDAVIELVQQQLLSFFGPLPIGDVARSAEPFDDVSVRAKNRNGARLGPPEAAIGANDAVLHVEGRLGADGIVDGRHDLRLVVLIKRLRKPALAEVIGVGNEVLPLQIAHLAPIGAHAVNDIRAGRDKGAEAFLACPQRLRRKSAIPGQLDVSLDSRQQLARAERLDQIVVGACSHALHAAFLAGTGRQKDNRNRTCLVVGAQPPEQFQSVHAGYHDVGQNQIRLSARACGKGGLTIADNLELVVWTEQAAQVVAHVGAVVDDQHECAADAARSCHRGTEFGLEKFGTVFTAVRQPSESFLDKRRGANRGRYTTLGMTELPGWQMTSAPRDRHSEGRAFAKLAFG
jgi:hypothetical protein